uniref:Secreted protein n=1 Tax=Hydatigena taeniaeformis TaxID=6205 RepID=A0A0R3WIK3_HYDTA
MKPVLSVVPLLHASWAFSSHPYSFPSVCLVCPFPFLRNPQCIFASVYTTTSFL